MNIIAKLAPFFIALAGCMWGSIGVFIDHLAKLGFSATDFNILRAVFCTLILVLVLVIAKPSLLKVKPRHMWIFVCSGLCSVTMFNYCYTYCVQLTSLNVAAVLLYTAPAMVMLMSALFFREKITRRKLVALLLSFSGCLLVSGVLGSAAPLTTRGLLLGLGSGLAYALYSVFSRLALNRGYHGLTIAAVSFFFGSIGTLFVSPLGNIISRVGEEPRLLLTFTLMGAVCAALPYFLFTCSLRYVETSRAPVISSTEPVMATILGFFFLGQQPGAVGVAGMVLVVVAVVLLSRK